MFKYDEAKSWSIKGNHDSVETKGDRICERTTYESIDCLESSSPKRDNGRHKTVIRCLAPIAVQFHLIGNS